MNIHLREEIIKHVLSNFGVIYSEFLNQNKSKSLTDPEFLLRETLSFEVETDEVIHNKIWGCQFSSSSQEIKVLLGDCSQDSKIPEFALIIQLKNAPAYGLYLICHNQLDSESMIGCSVNQKDWMECSTYLQATFLAGMEKVKEMGLAWNKCSDYQSQYQLLLSFIKFHASFYEGNYEG